MQTQFDIVASSFNFAWQGSNQIIGIVLKFPVFSHFPTAVSKRKYDFCEKEEEGRRGGESRPLRAALRSSPRGSPRLSVLTTRQSELRPTAGSIPGACSPATRGRAAPAATRSTPLLTVDLWRQIGGGVWGLTTYTTHLPTSRLYSLYDLRRC